MFYFYYFYRDRQRERDRRDRERGESDRRREDRRDDRRNEDRRERDTRERNDRLVRYKTRYIYGLFTECVCNCDIVKMGTIAFYGAVLIEQRSSSEETIANANAITHCQWTLTSLCEQ